MGIIDEVEDATERIADLLSSVSADIPIRGLDWNAAELATHLLTIPLRHRQMQRSPQPFPASLSRLNADELAEFGVRPPHEVAVLLPEAVKSLVVELGTDEERSVPFFGMQHTVGGLLGVLLGELVVHGLDLARTVGEPWPITAHQATLALCGVLPVAVHSVDEATARAMGTSIVHIRLRPDVDWTLSIESGTVAIGRGAPERADLHISVDPVTQLLLGYGRTSRLRAALTGRVVAYGRKPWLAPMLSRLFVET